MKRLSIIYSYFFDDKREHVPTLNDYVKGQRVASSSRLTHC